MEIFGTVQKRRCLKPVFLPFLLALVFCVSGCGTGNAPGQSRETAKTGEEVQVVDETFEVIEELPPAIEEEEVEMPVETEAPGYPISTIVGNLEFPAEWADCIRVEDQSTAALGLVNVYGTAEGKEALLFTMSMGESDEGFLFGSAPDNNGGMAEIRIAIEDFIGDETWSDSAAEQIRNMQSRVNDLIEQIYALPGFVRAQ